MSSWLRRIAPVAALVARERRQRVHEHRVVLAAVAALLRAHALLERPLQAAGADHDGVDGGGARGEREQTRRQRAAQMHAHRDASSGVGTARSERCGGVAREEVALHKVEVRARLHGGERAAGERVDSVSRRAVLSAMRTLTCESSISPLASSMCTRARGNSNERTSAVMPLPEHTSSSAAPSPSAGMPSERSRVRTRSAAAHASLQSLRTDLESRANKRRTRSSAIASSSHGAASSAAR